MLHDDAEPMMTDSDSERNLYGSPTLPDLVTAASSSEAMASFSQCFPKDWLSPPSLSSSDVEPRISEDSTPTPTPTRTTHDVPPVPPKATPPNPPHDTKAHTLSAPAAAPVREYGSSPAVLLSPPRAGYARSKSAQAVQVPLSVSPPRRGFAATASLYNMRNIPMSAPAHKTVFGGSHHHSASVSGAGVGWRGTRDVEFRMDVFAAADSEHEVTDDEKERMAPPPPFFYPRAVSVQSLAQDAAGGALYPSPKTPMYSQSDRNSMVDVSDAASMMSVGKKSKFRTAMTKSIPRAISKHLLRKPASSSDLSSKLIADESFGCIGLDSDWDDSDFVSRQNASLKAIPDSFKRLFTPPTSAPPVPPLPAAMRRPPSTNSIRSQATVPSRTPSNASTGSQNACRTEPLLPAVTLRTEAPREQILALPRALLPRSDRASAVTPLSRVPTLVDDTSDPEYGVAAALYSPAATSMYGSSSDASSSTPSLLRTPDELQGPEDGCAPALVPGEETPVRRKRDGMLNGPTLNDLRSHSCYDDALTSEPESYVADSKAPPSVFPEWPTPLGRAMRTSSTETRSTSDGSDLGLDALMWPMPPARTVNIDAASGQSWQEVSSAQEYYPPGTPVSLDARVDFRVHTPTTSQSSSAAQSPVSPNTVVPSPAAQTLSKSQLIGAVRSVLGEDFVHSPRTPTSPYPTVTVTMPSERFMITRSAPVSPGMLSPQPQHPHKPSRRVPSPSEARTQTYMTDIDSMLPAKIIVNREEKVAIDAPRWSELVAYCRENEDTIIRETLPSTPRPSPEQPSVKRLQVCVYEVGEYNNDNAGVPDINDPKHFRVMMTLTVRPEAPRIDTLFAAAPMLRSRSVSPSPSSVYSCSSRALSLESLPSPAFSTPPLSLNASTPPSSFNGSSAPPSVLFSAQSSAQHTSFTQDSAMLDSSIQASALLMAKRLRYTPLTSPNGSMMGLANIGEDGLLKKPMVIPPSPDVELPPSPTSAESAPRGRTRMRKQVYEGHVYEEQPPMVPVITSESGGVKRELILNFSVPMPTVLGQIINMASQRSFGEGVGAPF